MNEQNQDPRGFEPCAKPPHVNQLWWQLNRRTSSSLPFPFILSPFSLHRFLLSQLVTLPISEFSPKPSEMDVKSDIFISRRTRTIWHMNTRVWWVVILDIIQFMSPHLWMYTQRRDHGHPKPLVVAVPISRRKHFVAILRRNDLNYFLFISSFLRLHLNILLKF